MSKVMRNSSLYVALNGRDRELIASREKIEKVFSELFEDSAKLVSESHEEFNGEFIYEIKTPIVNDEEMTKDFFGSLEVMFEELIEYTPYFTKFRRVE